MRQTQRDTDRKTERERDIIIDRQTESERVSEREGERESDAKIRLIMTSRLTKGENGRNVVQRSIRKTLGMQYEKNEKKNERKKIFDLLAYYCKPSSLDSNIDYEAIC